MSVLVSYVHGGMLHEEFAHCYKNLCQFDAGPSGRRIIGGECRVRGLYVADSRNQACRRFLAAEYPNEVQHILGNKPQWLLFLDTDIVFKPQDVYALLDAADPEERPIVGGLYFGYVEGKPTPVWRQLHQGLNDQTAWGTMAQVTIGDIYPIDAVGMGFTIIHRSVLEALAKKYAGDTWTWFAHDPFQGERLGEDLSFCYRAKQLGFTTWGDSRIIVGHIKPFTIGLEHFTDACKKATNANL